MKVLKLSHSELSPIISDNVIGHAKSAHDFSDEFDHFSRYNRGRWLYFDPFCEFIYFHEVVCESTFFLS
jgi:hypothetical protein